MKNRTFLRSIIGILLVAQLWATVVSHCNWTADLEIELCDKGDSDPKEENTKEKDDKLKVDLSILKFDDYTAFNIARIFPLIWNFLSHDVHFQFRFPLPGESQCGQDSPES